MGARFGPQADGRKATGRLATGHTGETNQGHFRDVALGQSQWYNFGVGEFTTHFKTYFSGDWEVHWGHDLDHVS